MKKTLCFLLSVLTVISVVAVFPSAAEADKPMSYKLYDPNLDSQKNPVEIAPGSKYGLCVTLNTPFTAAGFCMPTWSRTDCSATIAVYKWANDYDSTVAAEPVATKDYPVLRDCATNYIDFDEQPAGKYYFVIYNTVGTVGIWRYPMTKSHGFAYMDGAEDECDLEVTVKFTKTVTDPTDKTVSMYEVSGEVTTYPEYEIPKDDILNTRDAYADTWVCIDGLGRTVASNEQTGNPKEDKTVGLFYWSWHNDLAGNEPFNINNFMLENPEAKNDYKYAGWPTSGVSYFWNESIYGYYRTVDRWVIRKQAELFAAAGVDVIFFDNTNGNFTWRSSYNAIYDVFEEARRDGVLTPQISFLLPFGPTSGSLEQIRAIYTDIYRRGKYQDLWFYWDGKPMIMGHPDNLGSGALDSEIKDFFTFRPGQPAYDGSDKAVGKWGWLSIYKQDIYYATTKDKKQKIVEQMSVGISQNSSKQYLCTAMNGEGIFGRSYTHKDGFAHLSEENSSLYGYNFAEQWEYALEVNPKMIFVTGWNEWTAGRQEFWGEVENAFADEFNDEYSRDIEPTKGSLKDHYYYQMVSYIRQYKGTRAVPVPSAKTAIDIKASAEQWSKVAPYYIAYAGNTDNRDAQGYGSLKYTDSTGRNDIYGAQLARDDKYLYIMVECANDISPYTDSNWMTVYLDTVNGGLDGWESFDYVINKTAATESLLTLEKFTGSEYNTESVGTCEYSVSGKYLQIKVDRKLLGITDDNFTVNFKVTDNVQNPGDIMNFYTSGDVAPVGRFKYSYVSTKENAGAPVVPETAENTTVPDTDDNSTATAASQPEESGNNTVIIIVCAVLGVVVIAAAVIIIVRKKQTK